MNFTTKLALATFTLSSSSFALVGFGGHYAPNMGEAFPKASENFIDTLGTKASLDRGAVKDMAGFGVKLWIDVLPVVDVEATGNFAFGSYTSALHLQNEKAGLDTTLNIAAKMGYMGYETKATPLAFVGSGDLSVLYPFLKFPPVINMVKIYAGGGVSYKFNSAVLSKSFLEKAASDQIKALASAASTNGNANGNVENAGADLAKTVATQIASEGLETGVGGHVMVGARAKLPIIPIAAYANYKYYFGGLGSPMKQGGLLEIGGGLAF